MCTVCVFVQRMKIPREHKKWVEANINVTHSNKSNNQNEDDEGNSIVKFYERNVFSFVLFVVAFNLNDRYLIKANYT